MVKRGAKTDKTSTQRRAELSRTRRRSHVDDRATGRKKAPEPEVDPESIPVSPQDHPGRNAPGRPPSPFRD